MNGGSVVIGGCFFDDPAGRSRAFDDPAGRSRAFDDPAVDREL